MKISGFRSVLVFLAVFLTSFPLWALETPQDQPPPTPKIDIYLEKVDKKFDRGVINFAAGWTEMVRQPGLAYQQKDKGNAVWRVTQGAGKGLVVGAADVLGGFANAATALIPYFEIPLPEDGIQPANITGGNAEKAAEDFDTSLKRRSRLEQKKPVSK